MKFFSQYQNLFYSTGPVCQTCGKVFSNDRNLKQHQHSIHKKSTLFSCAQCDYTTPLKSNLNRHTKRHSKTHLTSNLPPKIACREPIPNIIDPPANDHLLEQLENQEIESMFEQNTQRGFGITQMTEQIRPYLMRYNNFLEMNDLGEQTEIFGKSTSKIFLVFAIQKPSTDDPEFTLDT